MNMKKFSDAMSELDTKYIDEALNYKKKAKSPGWFKWGAIAACLCITLVIGLLVKTHTPNIVTSAGFLTITAYATSSNEAVTMEEGIEIPVNYNWTPSMSWLPGIPLELSVSEHPNIIFEISVDRGELILWQEDQIINMDSSFEAENGATIYWRTPSETESGNVELYKETQAHIDIIMREGENIVGYAVIGIYTDEAEQDIYYAKLLKSVSFPKLNGNYQRITTEYIEAEIQRFKNEGAHN